MNVYENYLQQKGYTVAECRRPAQKREFPCTIGARYYETEEAYKEALYEFLNGL